LYLLPPFPLRCLYGSNLPLVCGPTGICSFAGEFFKLFAPESFPDALLLPRQGTVLRERCRKGCIPPLVGRPFFFSFVSFSPPICPFASSERGLVKFRFSSGTKLCAYVFFFPAIFGRFNLAEPNVFFSGRFFCVPAVSHNQDEYFVADVPACAPFLYVLRGPDSGFADAHPRAHSLLRFLFCGFLSPHINGGEVARYRTGRPSPFSVLPRRFCSPTPPWVSILSFYYDQ